MNPREEENDEEEHVFEENRNKRTAFGKRGSTLGAKRKQEEPEDDVSTR